jgi:hypothetical protein
MGVGAVLISVHPNYTSMERLRVLLVRNSEVQTFKTCRHRWAWTYRDERQAAQAAGALRFGSLVHAALAAYYVPGRKRGPKPWTTFERVYWEEAEEMKDRGFEVMTEETWVSALDLGTAMLHGYVERYAMEDEAYEVISSEQTFQLPVRVPAHDGVPAFTFKAVGTFDGVWRHIASGRLSFKEFKTTVAISMDGLPMDEQAGMYWTYGPKWLRKRGLLKEGELPSDILYTFLRKAAPDNTKRTNAEGHVLNKDGTVSQRQPAPYFARVPVYRDAVDRQNMHERVVQEATDLWLARAGRLPLYKNPGYLFMPNCRFCPVREACELHETGGDWGEVLAQTTVQWNPYEAHELRED